MRQTMKQVKRTMVSYLICALILFALYAAVNYLIPVHIRPVSDVRKIIIASMCVTAVEVIPFGSLSNYTEYSKQYKWIMLVNVQIASQNGHLCHIRRPPCDLNGGHPRTH